MFHAFSPFYFSMIRCTRVSAWLTSGIWQGDYDKHPKVVVIALFIQSQADRESVLSRDAQRGNYDSHLSSSDIDLFKIVLIRVHSLNEILLTHTFWQQLQDGLIFIVVRHLHWVSSSLQSHGGAEKTMRMCWEEKWKLGDEHTKRRGNRETEGIDNKKISWKC